MDECTIVMFFKVIFEILPRPRGARQALADSRRIVGITATAQATSIHLIVTAVVQACQYSRVIFVSVNLQRNIA